MTPTRRAQIAADPAAQELRADARSGKPAHAGHVRALMRTTYDGVWYAWPPGWGPPLALTEEVAAQIDVLDPSSLPLPGGLGESVENFGKRTAAAQEARADGQPEVAEAIERAMPGDFARFVPNRGLGRGRSEDIS